MRFCTVNLGCKVNRVETDQAASLLLSYGFDLADQSNADVILVNTCTVTGEAEKKTRKAVRHALRSNMSAQVMVTGCASAVDAQTYKDMDPRVVIVPKVELMSYLEQEFAPEMGYQSVLRSSESFRTRVGVKVQDGCNNACTYCIVHVARGKATSRPKDQIVYEVQELALSGVKEIVLTGINLGTYSYQAEEDMYDLASLLKELLTITQDMADGIPPRFRISSIEPKNVDDNLIQLLSASDGRICRHLHLPLQSGSNKVLKEMARPYKADYFCALVDRLRSAVPDIALSTDIIAGFPGESEEEFQETLEVAKYARFMKIHSFPYSMRLGTPAAKRSDQIDPLVKATRAEALRKLSDELCQQDLNFRKGKTELALVEPDEIATTESYHVVTAPQGVPVGALVEVCL